MIIYTNYRIRVIPVKRIYKTLDAIENKKGMTELSKVIEKQNKSLYNKVNILV